jgi:hypothetical protein
MRQVIWATNFHMWKVVYGISHVGSRRRNSVCGKSPTSFHMRLSVCEFSHATFRLRKSTYGIPPWHKLGDKHARVKGNLSWWSSCSCVDSFLKWKRALRPNLLESHSCGVKHLCRVEYMCSLESLGKRYSAPIFTIDPNAFQCFQGFSNAYQERLGEDYL